VGIVCLLANRSPSLLLDENSPPEVWNGMKPSLKNLRVLGCDSYVHLPKEKKSKMDKMDEKCIFISYTDGLKRYNTFNP